MMDKIAVLSDVHGNVTALRATITDAQLAGATEFWFLGDLFMPGPGVGDLLDELGKINLTVWLRGNWDNVLGEVIRGEIYLSTGHGQYAGRLAGYVIDNLTDAQLKTIEGLPDSTTRNVSGLEIALSHNLPGKNWGPELVPGADNAVFARLLSGNTDVAVYGHTHRPVWREADNGAIILNPGSVGNPYSLLKKFLAQRDARYLLLNIDKEARVEVDFRHVAYDVEVELALAKQRELPFIALYEENLHTGAYFSHNEERLAPFAETHDYPNEIAAILRSRGLG
jgi:predicted phosphodiesterase